MPSSTSNSEDSSGTGHSKAPQSTGTGGSFSFKKAFGIKKGKKKNPFGAGKRSSLAASTAVSGGPHQAPGGVVNSSSSSVVSGASSAGGASNIDGSQLSSARSVDGQLMYHHAGPGGLQPIAEKTQHVLSQHKVVEPPTKSHSHHTTTVKAADETKSNISKLAYPNVTNNNNVDASNEGKLPCPTPSEELVDNSFLHALRVDADRSSQSSSVADTSTVTDLADSTLSREIKHAAADTAFLKAFRGAGADEDFGDDAVPRRLRKANNDTAASSNLSSTTAQASAKSKVASKISKVQPPVSTNRSRAVTSGPGPDGRVIANPLVEANTNVRTVGAERDEGSNAAVSDADSAFLRALRAATGDPESSNARDKSSAPSSQPGQLDDSERGNDADNAFLRALRGGAEAADEAESSGFGNPTKATYGAGRAKGGGKGRGKVAPPVFTNRANRAMPTSTKESPAVDSASDEDSSFLRALRGGDTNTWVAGNGSAPQTQTTRLISPESEKSNNADSAFLKALQGDTDDNFALGQKSMPANTAKPTKLGAMSDADVNFLAAMRGAIQNPSHATPSTSATRNVLDTDTSLSLNNNDSGAEVNHGGSFVVTSKQNQKKNTPKAVAAPVFSNLATSNNTQSNPNEEMAYANAAFLGALHASTDTPDDVRGSNARNQPADGSFILNSRPKPWQNQSGNPDAEFLMAIHGSQAPQGNAQSKQSYSSGTNDSGTLVLNSPDERGGGPKKHNLENSKAAFLMAIQSSNDDRDATTRNYKSRGDGIANCSKIDGAVVETDDDDDDDDVEDLQVPSQPFIEKIFLPRPLFFGHILPPRIIEAAKHAASIHTLDCGSATETISPGTDSELEKTKFEVIPQDGLRRHEESSQTHPLKSTNVYQSYAISLSSKTNTSSNGLLIGKKIGSPLSPCYRNLEGALETFGFGVNPLSFKQEISHEDEKSTITPNAPHPYVSLYSPVWHDWSRTCRAKAKHRKDKLEGKANAVKTALPMTNDSKDHVDSSSRMLSTRHPQSAKQVRLGPNHVVKRNTEAFPPPTSTVTTETAGDLSSDNSLFSQDLFSHYARAESDSITGNIGGNDGDSFLGNLQANVSDCGTFISTPSNKSSVTPPQSDSSTFVQAVKGTDGGGDGDDDSIEAAEERKTVGWNDNISAAAAMLAGIGVGDDDGDENVRGGICTSTIMARGGGEKAANKYGRPYSNFELTNGCVPLFGCDDPSLPHESDMGVFETKDEEKRSVERRREKDIIEDLAVPGIMAHVTCPTNCSDVDDSQTWNSRVAATESGNCNRGNTNTILISLDGHSTSDVEKNANDLNKSPVFETSRIGWWNLPNGPNEVSRPIQLSKRKNRKSSLSVEVFPACDDPIPLDVQTNLWPPAQLLRENNFAMSKLHSATSTARYLPHLSDRPPSVRYLQIDTTAVGFPKLGGEIEPMFCKLAIYHFEMNSEKQSNGYSGKDGESVSTGMSSVPSPNMDRCGRVTEALSFDIVQDSSVVENCKRALWPYADESEINGHKGCTGDAKLEGTPCGIFPLPANLNISNLFAVITVHKVLSDPSDLQPYFKSSRREARDAKSKHEDIDLGKLRQKAGKASDQFGKFITPFAFGVVPLMHIIGNEAPKVPVSRAVQIPLFKFVSGRGSQSILDHILVMLYPRAESSVGKAASMTRGHALLVMRYFGFLGLHSIIEKKSSLARDRLVDFTGELQVKRNESELEGGKTAKVKCPILGENYILPPWRPEFVVEPTKFGGRNNPRHRAQGGSDGKETQTNMYAQEIASLPLERFGSNDEATRGRSRSSRHDHVKTHTSFCNELICQPTILRKCPKKNIVIKIELREIQWSESLKVDIAVPVESSIHNTRRGPWLVREAFTSCALGASEPQFLDEFKIKLPLILGESGHEKIGLFFSVYHVTVKKKKLTGLRAMSKQRDSNSIEDFDDTTEHLGSGFLPLTQDGSPTCLLANGDHEVPINLRTIQLVDTADGTNFDLPSPSVGKHRKSSSFSSAIGRHVRSWSGSISNASDDVIKTTLSNETIEESCETTEFQPRLVKYPRGTLALGRLLGRLPPHDHSAEFVADDGEDSDGSEDSMKSDSGISRAVLSEKVRRVTIGGEPSERDLRPVYSSENVNTLETSSLTSHASEQFKCNMILQVNVVAFTSVHPQNKTLADFFKLSPKVPRCVTSADFSETYSPWGKHRSEILYRIKPERIPPFYFVGGVLAEVERKLLEPVLGLSKSSKCSHAELLPHLLRVVSQLWRTMVTGTGEPSILWASPESLIPLRLNAFATLLHTISSASYHMSKSERQLDGSTKWNLNALGKMLVMLFDESSILPGPPEYTLLKDSEKVVPKSNDLQPPSRPQINKPSILSNRSKTTTHVKPTLGVDKPAIVSRFSSDESHSKFDVDAMLKSSKQYLKQNESSIEKIEEDGEYNKGISLMTSGAAGFRVDSKNDFMSNLAKSSLDGDADASCSRNTKKTGDALLNAFGNPLPSFGPAANRRRWMTLPSNALATIQENDTDDGRQKRTSSNETAERGDALDAELILREKKGKPTQFRVPQVEPSEDSKPMFSFLDEYSPPVKRTELELKEGNDSFVFSHKQRSLPKNNDEIESAGTAFLDQISKSIGLTQVVREMGAEEKRVGAAHHRKTRSRCSIDWSLPPTDKLLEKDQQMEQLNRNRAGSTALQTPSLIPLSAVPGDGSSDVNLDASYDVDKVNPRKANSSSAIRDENTDNLHPLKRQYQSAQGHSSDRSDDVYNITLPDFADRMSAMRDDGKPKRWWPYVYEVVIYQWLALLIEQTKKGEKTGGAKQGSPSTSGLSPIVVKYLSHAAKAARGATIRCAPYLLEIIKQSLSWRVDSIFRRKENICNKDGKASSEGHTTKLVKLDENVLAALEKLITMLTDASIDSRNFDSFEFRKISIDVNDAVVRFLRDLFSVLEITSVHRLILVYFSRFVVKEGKHWHDRDSKSTGLRCSWETTKLRLNAVTLFVRFPEFMKVNIPLMDSWKAWPDGSSVGSTRHFFKVALDKITDLGLSEFSASEGPVRKEPLEIPKLKPHWLAELCTDICLSATGHAEQNIQYRASSLLFELFWRISQQGRAKGNISVGASVFVPFVPKVLGHMNYLSSLPAKCQLRKDIIPCALLVLQSAPVGLMRALWRKLSKRAENKTSHRDSAERYGGIVGSGIGPSDNLTAPHGLKSMDDDFEIDNEPDIYDMFGLLNMSLATMEYEGNDVRVDENIGEVIDSEEYPTWRKEFLISEDRDQQRTAIDRIRFPNQRHGGTDSDVIDRLSTCNSRRWHAHDSSIVIIHSCRHIVRETLGMLRPSMALDEHSDQDEGSLEISASRSLSDCFLHYSSFDSSTCDASGQLHEEKKQSRLERRLNRKKGETLAFSVTDTIIFVRAATSVYLHALTIKQSDIVIVKTLTAAVEIVKIFGIKVFLAAVGETLQHWMRVLLEHCGARRAEIRVDASEFLNLLLRLTWDSYGSFFRIRLPLLAVQTEVMDRIVANAATKYVTEQRRLGLNPVLLSNDAAEASLTPLWRTIHRLQNQSVSRNLSFKSALARLAIMMKKLFKAYLAAHALTIVNRSETTATHIGDVVPSQVNPYVQRMRVSVHRIVSNAAGFSKQFLGNQVLASLDRSSIQTEAVEDAFLSATDVFSSTELPFHRVEWLQMLAEFHKMRGRFAEEATCRCNIYHTYREAAKQHEHIWSSSPFLPWVSNSSDGIHHDGEGPGGGAIFADYGYEMDNLSVGSGKNFDRSTSFRRIFYRAADSVRVRTGDWGVVGGGRYLFYGVTLKSEFDTVSPWYSLRDMEEYMVKEAETCGDLYLRAGIVESSRYCWSLVTQFYSETFNYARLANVYRKLALVVTSQIPVIDKSSQIDLTSPIGRFYKVYFHGGAPDDLNGIEFVYRAPNSVHIKDFGSRLESAVRSILPSKSTIDLVLDDGSPTMVPKAAGNKRPPVIGGAPIEPIKIKVTPLRPLFKMENREKCFRGTPEWFQLKAEEYEYASIDTGVAVRAKNTSLHHRHQSLSTTNTFGSIGSVTMPSRRSSSLSKFRSSAISQNFHDDSDKGTNGELVGVDRFYFTQPQRKDPLRGFRDWLKVPKGRFAERSLRVTELQVENCFPACVTRQKVIHRAVFTQSPLEASVEAVSTWCSVLFRTVIATNGLSVLVGQRDQGLSANAAKVVADCIHSSGVKQIGLSFLVVNTRTDEMNNDGSMMYDSSKTLLSEEEVEKVQAKLARIIVIFLEMLHLLIARNRDVLLAVVQARKRKGGDISSMASASGSVHGGYAAASRTGSNYSPIKGHTDRQSSDSYYYERQNGDGIGKSFGSDNPMNYGHHVSNSSDRTDAAIGVQSELQRGFIGLVKALSPNIMDTINSEVPRWLRQCCQENYFSSGRYRQAKIPIADELFFNVDTTNEREGKADSSYNEVPRSIIDRSSSGCQSQRGSSPNGSLCGTETSESKRMERSISINSDRLIQERSQHRRTPSGASHASSSRVAI